MTRDKHNPPEKQHTTPGELLSREAQSFLKMKFGRQWRQAWVAWQMLPSGTWFVTQVKRIDGGNGFPANSGSLICFDSLKKPSPADMAGLMAHGFVPTPTYTAEELLRALEGKRP